MSKVNIGFIGAGGIASRHIGNLLGFSDVRIKAIADPALERAKEQAARCPQAVETYDNFRNMLDREKLDALYICVPPFAHGEPELSAVERGLPFFVEKPLAVDFETAATIASKIADAKLITAVGYHWRYLDTTEEAKELLSKNPARLALGYWLDSTPPPAWWRIETQSGGQIVEQTTHIFDLARVLVGDVESVFAAGASIPRAEFPDMDVCDVSVATLRFKTGALGQMASTCLLKWPHRIGLHLFGDGLAIELSEFEIMIDIGRGRPVRAAEGDPFVREDRAFIDAVLGKENTVRAHYDEAMRTHTLTTTAARSIKEGRELKVDA